MNECVCLCLCICVYVCVRVNKQCMTCMLYTHTYKQTSYDVHALYTHVHALYTQCMHVIRVCLKFVLVSIEQTFLRLLNAFHLIRLFPN